MSDEKKEKIRKRLKLIFFKIPIILLVIGAVLAFALTLVEKYPEPLRQGFEKQLSRSTGRVATIGVLETIKFFPQFVLSANHITLHNPTNAAVIDLEIENINWVAPFSTLFFGAKKINSFKMTKMTAVKGMLGPKEIYVDGAEILTLNGPEQFGSFFMANGKINGEISTFQAEVEPGRYSFIVPKIIPFSFKLGDRQVSGQLDKKFSSVYLKNIVYSVGDKQSEGKEFILNDEKKYNLENPVSCLLIQDDLIQCDHYLINKEK